MKKRQLVRLSVFLLITAVYVAGMLWWEPAPKASYEALVMMRDQSSGNADEDRRSSLKAGDVILVQKEGHSWSDSERISYLILKMSLTEEQAQRLTQPLDREVGEDELSDEEKQRIEDEKKRAQERGTEFRREPRRITLMARQYRIDLEEIGFPGTEDNANSLMGSQPFPDRVFDWGSVEKKKLD